MNALFWSFLEQAGAKAIQLLVQIVLARILAPDAFGVLAILLVVTNVADSIAQSGLGLALIQKSNSNERSYSTAWWLSLGVAVALYMALFVCSPIIASFYSMPQLVPYLRVLSLVILFNAANSIQRSYFQRKLDFKSIFKATTVAALVSGVVGIALACLGAELWALVGQYLSQSVALCIAMWIQLNWRPAFEFDRNDARELFGYGWKVAATGILNVLYTGVSELVIGKACPAADLGLYSQGRKYPQAAIGVVSNAIANVLLPKFASLKDNEAALRSSLKNALSVGCFIVVPVSLMVAVVAEPLVRILLTDKWLGCVPVFQLACVSSAALMLQLVNLRAYMALGDSALYLRLQIIKVVLGGGVISATAIVTGDIYFTAAATCLVGLLSVLFVDMPPAKRVHGYGALCQLKDQAPVFALAVLAAGVAAGASLMNLSAPVTLLFQVVVYLAVYLTGCMAFKISGFRYAAGVVAKIWSGVQERKRK